MAMYLSMMFLVMGLKATSAQIGFNNWKAPGLSGGFKQSQMQSPTPFKRADSAAYTSPTPMPAKPPSSMPFVTENASFAAFPKVSMPNLQPTDINWVHWPSAAPSSQGDAITGGAPQPQQQTTSHVQQPNPAALASDGLVPACSTTDASPEAVLHCVNAVRTNPRVFTDGYPCNWQSWIDGVSSPARAPLRPAAQLTLSAEGHAEWMARTKQFGHTGEGGSSVAQRIAATGWDQFPQAENIAVRYHSAYDVTMAWTCSEGHRSTLTLSHHDTCQEKASKARNSKVFRLKWHHAYDIGRALSDGIQCPVGCHRTANLTVWAQPLLMTAIQMLTSFKTLGARRPTPVDAKLQPDPG